MTTATWRLPAHGTEARYCPGKNGRPACHCPLCTRAARLANIRRARIRAMYGSNVIDRDILLPHIERLLAGGMSQGGIARAANVSASTISYIVLGKLKACQREKAVRILAVEPGFDDRAPRPAIGTTRRVRALYAIGHGQTAIARETGLSESAISHIANTLNETVSAATAAKISAAYRKLIARPGTSRKAKDRAREEGWPGPLAWGDNIDDPKARPEIRKGHARGRVSRAATRRDEIRHLATLGESTHHIAKAVGMDEGYVRGLLHEIREAA